MNTPRVGRVPGLRHGNTLACGQKCLGTAMVPRRGPVIRGNDRRFRRQVEERSAMAQQALSFQAKIVPSLKLARGPRVTPSSSTSDQKVGSRLAVRRPRRLARSIAAWDARVFRRSAESRALSKSRENRQAYVARVVPP